jgi:hypothetical protein
MSFGATALVFHHSKATKSADLLVLTAIANFIGDEGAWPSVATIAHFARISERSVFRSLGRLEQLGEIKTVSKGGKGKGVYKTNFYEITIVCPDNCAGDWNHTIVDSVRSRGDIVSGLEVTRLADKPITEPVIELTNVAQSETDQRFDDFWASYPHRPKESKKAARTAFKRLTIKNQKAAIAGAKLYAADPDLPAKGSSDRWYIPMAVTWLHQERWNDLDEKPVTKVEDEAEWG